MKPPQVGITPKRVADRHRARWRLLIDRYALRVQWIAWTAGVSRAHLHSFLQDRRRSDGSQLVPNPQAGWLRDVGAAIDRLATIPGADRRRRHAMSCRDAKKKRNRKGSRRPLTR